MSFYEPTVWRDHETPVNAKNLNKSEQATSQQGKDILFLSQAVNDITVVLSNDLSIIRNDLLIVDNVSKVNKRDISIMSNSIVTLSEDIKNKADKNHTHSGDNNGSNIDLRLLKREIYKYIKII